MEIVFFGDSHLMALIAANRANKVFPNAHMFPVAQPHFERTTFLFEEGRLQANFEKTRENFSRYGEEQFIKINDGAVLVLVSWFVRPITMFQMMGATSPARTYLPPQLYRSNVSEVPISDKMYRTYLRQAAQFEMGLMSDLREKHKGQIVLVPRPMPATTSAVNTQFRKTIESDVKLQVYKDMIKEIHGFAKTMNMTFVSQDLKTFDQKLMLTDEKYTRGSLSMTTGEAHDSTDHVHMNADYGAIMLSQIKKAL